MLLSLLLAAACGEVAETSSAGRKIGEIYVTAFPGAKTVLVSLDGLWRVRTDEEWISFDVNGRDGEGAFTLWYASNVSDFVTSHPARRGAVVVESLKDMRADTLYVIQQGVPDGNEYASSTADGTYIEFADTPFATAKVCYADFSGASEADVPAIKAWLEANGIDVLAAVWTDAAAATLAAEYDGNALTHGGVLLAGLSEVPDLLATTDVPASLTAQVGGIAYSVAGFGADSSEEERYSMARTLLESGYDRPESPARWLVGGSFYYLSVMETGYPSTPSWYPSDPSDTAFTTDRYMQAANLVDCVWMTRRGYTPTYTAGERSWRADYVYASSSVWNAATVVEVYDAPIAAMTHRPIGITVKY